MTKKITDLEGRLESAFNRADSIPHTITLTRAELQAEVKRLTEALRETREQRDELFYLFKMMRDEGDGDRKEIIWEKARDLITSLPAVKREQVILSELETIYAKYKAIADKPDSIGGYCCTHTAEYERKSAAEDILSDLNIILHAPRNSSVEKQS